MYIFTRQIMKYSSLIMNGSWFIVILKQDIFIINQNIVVPTI